jgi:transketolase
VGIPNLPVKIVGTVAGFLSEANGPTHQAVEDISLMRGIPNVNIFCPADEDDMIAGLEKILRNDSPYYIRFNNLKNSVPHSEFSPGKAEIFGSGNEITILTYGFLFNEAMKAMEILEKNGKKTKVINLRTLKPIDEAVIINAVKESRLAVILEDHFAIGGLYSIIAEILAKEKIIGNLLPLNLNEKWFKPALIDNVLEYEGFTGRQIAKKIMKAK